MLGLNGATPSLTWTFDEETLFDEETRLNGATPSLTWTYGDLMCPECHDKSQWSHAISDVDIRLLDCITCFIGVSMEPRHL